MKSFEKPDCLSLPTASVYPWLGYIKADGGGNNDVLIATCDGFPEEDVAVVELTICQSSIVTVEFIILSFRGSEFVLRYCYCLIVSQ